MSSQVLSTLRSHTTGGDAPRPSRPPDAPRVAYFSMEIALDPAIPTYAGALGMLAGDTLRAAADLALPLVAVSLVHRRGYFRQRVDETGAQTELDDRWSPEARLKEVGARVVVTLGGDDVTVRAWRYDVVGGGGHVVPVLLLDTDLPANPPRYRGLTDRLYGGGPEERLRQAVVLGCGGIALLERLGFRDLRRFHMNEGHSALLSLSLLERERDTNADTIQAVRERCVFTTHTPVPFGHDLYPAEVCREVLGHERADRLLRIGCCPEGTLNLTHVALFFSRYVNGVALRHSETSRGMFPGYPVASIDNGVHAGTWVSRPFAEVFDRHVPAWRAHNANLRYAESIPLGEVRAAHVACKRTLLDEVERRTGARLDGDRLTLGVARRMTPHKRPDLLLSDHERLRRIAADHPLQILYAGKAHPRDDEGKRLIGLIYEHAVALADVVPIVFLEDYDMALAGQLCAGVDLWINTPRKPEEASGTSGMKAALNGVPQLSSLDGWWVAGHVEGVTGWSAGDDWQPRRATDDDGDARQLYEKLALIAAGFYERPAEYARIMRHAIALNGSFFNAQRMVRQYSESAYGLRTLT